MLRFSHCAVPVGNVPSTGMALTAAAGPLSNLVLGLSDLFWLEHRALVEGWLGWRYVDLGTASMEIEGMEEPYQDAGKYMVVCEKQADGTWLMKATMWNSDIPMPE